MQIETMRHEGFLEDAMHGMDGGFAPECVSNVFVEIMDLGHWGNSQELKAKGLDKALKTWYRDTKEQCKI